MKKVIQQITWPNEDSSINKKIEISSPIYWLMVQAFPGTTIQFGEDGNQGSVTVNATGIFELSPPDDMLINKIIITPFEHNKEQISRQIIVNYITIK